MKFLKGDYVGYDYGSPLRKIKFGYVTENHMPGKDVQIDHEDGIIKGAIDPRYIVYNFGEEIRELAKL